MKTLFQKTPRLVLALVGLAIFGLVRGPFEERLREDLVEAKLLFPPPGQSVMEQMGQSALMGTLGGLRPLVALYLSLEAHGQFSDKDWESLKGTYNIITSLEPRDEEHWIAVIWHLGINATANMQIDESIPEFERERRFNDYILEAIDFGERGLEQNPESGLIRMQLAEVYREKLKDDCETARIYGDAIGQPGAPPYVRRFHGYFMARCPGREKEAYTYLMGLYREGEQQHLPTLIKEIKTLEEKLSIPSLQRIPNADPDRRPGYRTKKPKAPENVLPGGIVVP